MSADSAKRIRLLGNGRYCFQSQHCSQQNYDGGGGDCVRVAVFVVVVARRRRGDGGAGRGQQLVLRGGHGELAGRMRDGRSTVAGAHGVALRPGGGAGPRGDTARSRAVPAGHRGHRGVPAPRVGVGRETRAPRERHRLPVDERAVPVAGRTSAGRRAGRPGGAAVPPAGRHRGRREGSRDAGRRAGRRGAVRGRHRLRQPVPGARTRGGQGAWSGRCRNQFPGAGRASAVRRAPPVVPVRGFRDDARVPRDRRLVRVPRLRFPVAQTTATVRRHHGRPRGPPTACPDGLPKFHRVRVRLAIVVGDGKRRNRRVQNLFLNDVC